MRIYEVDKQHRIFTNGIIIMERLLSKSESPMSIQITIHDFDKGFLTEGYHGVSGIDNKEFIDGSRGGPSMGLPENITKKIEREVADLPEWQKEQFEAYFTPEPVPYENNEEDEEEYPKDIYGC